MSFKIFKIVKNQCRILNLGLKTILKKDSKNEIVYFNRAYNYYKINRFDDAIRDYNTLIVINQKYPLANSYLGFMYFYKSQYLEAIPHFMNEIQNNHFAFDPYYGIGYSYFNLNSFDSCLIYMNKAIEIDSTSLDAYFIRGKSYILTKNIDLATIDFTRVLTMDSTFADAYSLRSVCYISKNKFMLALGDINKAISINSNVSDFYMTRADIYRCLNDKKKMLENYIKASELGNKTATNIIDANH